VVDPLLFDWLIVRSISYFLSRCILKRVITLLLHLTIYDFFVKYQHIRRFKSHLRRRITLTTIWRIVGRQKRSGRPPVWLISLRAPYAKIVCPRPRPDGQRRICRAPSLGLQVWVGSSGGRRQCFIAAPRRVGLQLRGGSSGGRR
jgi:hypothetical protein